MGRRRRATAPPSRAEIVRGPPLVGDRSPTPRSPSPSGLDAVSMRRIAREPGPGAMSLYHYFDSRDELLELMADRIAAEMVVPSCPASGARRCGRSPSTAAEPSAATRGYSRPARAHARHAEPDAPHRAVRPGRPAARRGARPAILANLVAAVDDYTVGYAIREGNAVRPEQRARGSRRRSRSRTSSTCSTAASSRS